MVTPASAICTKIALDFVYLFLVANTYFWGVFDYGDVRIEIFNIIYNFSNNGLSAYIKSSYSDFDHYLCSSSIPQTAKACQKLNNFKIGGECFIIVSAISAVFAAYSILNLIAKIYHITAKVCLEMDFFHYICPVLYSLAVVLYVSISEIFTISSNEITVQFGVFTMFGAELACLASCFIFLIHKKSINEISKINKDLNPQFKRSGTSKNKKIKDETLEKSESGKEP
jgi:hypothetical protein